MALERRKEEGMSDRVMARHGFFEEEAGRNKGTGWWLGMAL
jgi:hypothetical protein